MDDFSVIFEAVPDPRDINAQHDLRDMLFIALAAMLCGAESCVEMAEFGVEKEVLLRTILELKHGIPSHDTFSRVLRLLDPVALESAFTRFMEAGSRALGKARQDADCHQEGFAARRVSGDDQAGSAVLARAWRTS